MASIRVLRILEYIGDEASVWRTLDNGAVPSVGEVSHGGIRIKSGLIGRAESFDYVSKYLGEEPTNG